MEYITGTVEKITFQSNDGPFVVFRLQAPGFSSAVAVVGKLTAPLVGEEVEVAGEWVEHARFGRQLKADSYRRIAPTSEKGIERFLASGAIKGIGPSLAARMVSHFGRRTLEIIEHYPHRLVEVEGIGTKKAEAIRDAYASQAELREIMLFLEMHGISGGYGARIYAQYGAAAIEILSANPYRLAAEVDGIGFRTADQIAMSLGLGREQPERLAAGIHHALNQTAQAGHCCLPDYILVEETAKLLSVDTVEVALTLKAMLREGSLSVEDKADMTLIYPAWLYQAEKNTAERLLRLKAKAKQLPNLNEAETVANWEQQNSVALAEAQREALAASLAYGILVLTGGPGTGKTTTVRGILGVLEQSGLKILLGAPTGRAAKRLSEATGREAMTVHRLLEAAGGKEGAPLFARNEYNPLDADAIIIDEVSMMDIVLTSYLLRAVPEGCRVIFVGDVDQLPAVGPGSVLKDIIRSEAVPVVRLSEVFRQAGESIIVQNAHRINRGSQPQLNGSSDFQFRRIEDSDAVAEAIVSLCAKELSEEGFDVLREVQVLSPMHRQTCGVENLNRLLQEALNGAAVDKAALTSLNQTFRTGDKVMQMKNNYEKGVFNGDIGFIQAINEGQLYVRFPDNDVVYEAGELGELHLAYAMSVHKSQGSEYPVVVMPLVAGHHIMLQRNLLYTAVTRAKQKVIILGGQAALNTALMNDRTKRRYTLLAERLRGEDMC